jgi:acyl-CoA thioesterase FadM
MAKVFKTTLKVTFREADLAGIMFFGNIYGLAHDAFEDFIVATGFKWKEWFNTPEYIIPIRHSEADYEAPFIPGEEYDVTVSVKKLGTTSFAIGYVFSAGDKIHGQVEMVHVVMDAKTKKPIPLPGLIRERLSPYLVSP